ncbi:MAG: hypothetical protein Q8O26_10215 [Phreatobacter sp.]|uniref:hypothetical protein n=1 Tax=Phreatobacter sp. TaxID=1966341 RepID=UPI00273492E7|nr:hypothetical protein [Phreatobacter sp.]MDP2802246.1 hypothetical protein [Phreatobacter sp.]
MRRAFRRAFANSTRLGHGCSGVISPATTTSDSAVNTSSQGILAALPDKPSGETRGDGSW